jgi:hypothetical protein
MMPQRQVRKDLPFLPERMKKLPIDARGYPVPWFVQWIDGVPDFRITDRRKWGHCIRFNECWLCGEPIGRFKTFVLGPMCAVNRTTSEPPCHFACAEFAAIACPFLILPKAKRRDANLPEHKQMPGVTLARNPGATCLWTTRDYRLFSVDDRAPSARTGQLLRVGDPEGVIWFAEGRAATRGEVWGSIESGLPFLEAAALEQDAAQHSGSYCIDALHAQVEAFMQYLPAAA